MPDGLSAERGTHRAHKEGDEMPPRMLAVAEKCIHGGLTGRVGAGPNGPGLPRDEARFPSRRLGRNPPSGTPVTKKDATAVRIGCSE